MSAALRYCMEPCDVQGISADTVRIERGYRAPRMRRRFRRLLVTASLLFLPVVGLAVYSSPLNQLTLIPQPLSNTAAVRLLSAHYAERLGYVTITGSVQSLLSQPINHVEAEVEILNAKGQPIGFCSALLPTNSLAAHSKSSFQLIMPSIPGGIAYQVHFRKLMGSTLD